MKIKCYSVRVESVRDISDKCCLVRGFNGSESLIPKSQIYGQDTEVGKSDAYWISEWILEQKSLQYSNKKVAYFDKDSGDMLPRITITQHIPEIIINKEIIPDANLIR